MLKKKIWDLFKPLDVLSNLLRNTKLAEFNGKILKKSTKSLA